MEDAVVEIDFREGVSMARIVRPMHPVARKILAKLVRRVCRRKELAAHAGLLNLTSS